LRDLSDLVKDPGDIRTGLVLSRVADSAFASDLVDTSQRAEGRFPVIALGEAGATGPDAIDQAYGLAANLMTQQAAMLAFMDCFHLLSLVVLAGLPLAFFIRRF
jgi:hypothetical protein